MDISLNTHYISKKNLGDLYRGINEFKKCYQHRTMHEQMRNMYKILVGKPEGKKPLGRPMRRYVDNIKTNLKAIRCEGVDWIHVAQDREQCVALVNTVRILRVSINGGEFLD
jgi:hypothetical protein